VTWQLWVTLGWAVLVSSLFLFGCWLRKGERDDKVAAVAAAGAVPADGEG